MASKLITLQAEISDRLLADPFFASIPVVTEQIKDVANQISLNVSRMGLCCLVATPQASEPLVNLNGPYFQSIDLIVQVMELPTLNTALPQAMEVCEKVTALLCPPYIPTTISCVLKARSPLIKLIPDRVFRIYQVHFTASAGIVYTPEQVAAVTITNDPNPIVDPVATTPVEVTLACATGGAAIFYTLDGKHPAPRNGTRYTAPFEISTAATLRARAWLAGYNPSEIATSVYT